MGSMGLLREVRLIYTREHPVFRRDMTPLRAAIVRSGATVLDPSDAAGSATPGASGPQVN